MADLASSIKGLLASEKYSDLILTCRGNPFKVHCAIVCTRSPVLAAAVDGHFKEAISREIDLSDDELPIVRALISYLYAGDYDDTRDLKVPKDLSDKQASRPERSHPVASEVEPEATVMRGRLVVIPDYDAWDRGSSPEPLQPVVANLNPDALVFNVKMYIAGDKYDIPGLKDVAKLKYNQVVERCWNTTAFSDSVQLLWANTVESDISMKQVVFKTVACNVAELLDRGEFVDVLKSHGDLGVEVLRISFVQPKEVQPKIKKGRKKSSGWD